MNVLLARISLTRCRLERCIIRTLSVGLLFACMLSAPASANHSTRAYEVWPSYSAPEWLLDPDASCLTRIPGNFTYLGKVVAEFDAFGPNNYVCWIRSDGGSVLAWANIGYRKWFCKRANGLEYEWGPTQPCQEAQPHHPPIPAMKNPGPCNPCQLATARPINVGTGNKFLVENDYVGTGLFALRFTHYYNSTRDAVDGAAMGTNRRHTYERWVEPLTTPTGTVVGAFRHDGKGYTFKPIGSAWTAGPDVTARLIRLTDGSGTTTGWQFIDGDDEMEIYDPSGRLFSIVNRAGLAHTLAYSADGRLSSVTDAFGRSLVFAYDGAGRVASMTVGPDSYLYSYDATGVLKTVTYPDNTVKTYHYEVAGKPALLTGITDENNSRFLSYTYDGVGRAVSSVLAGGVDSLTIQFSSLNTVVTDARGTVRSFGNNLVYGVVKNATLDKPCSTCEALSYGYDANGFISQKRDFNNNRTNYTNDTRGLEIQRVEGLTSGGATTPVTRTTTTEWHAAYRLPTRIAEPFRITTMTYGATTDPSPGNRGSLLAKTVQATTDANGSAGLGAAVTGTPRTWAYTYNGNGQVLTVDGPRTDVSDVTTYTYYANGATCSGGSAIGCRGQIYTVTNAAGHVTTITSYNAHGQPLTIVDPNGLTTTLGYDARMRLRSRNAGGELTSYTYDNAGQLTNVALPDGSSVTYTYDAAHRLTQIADNLGNRIAYTLDLMGNRTKEDVFDPASALAQTRSRVYNNLNRLNQEIGAANQTTTFGYDNQGNVTSIDGPLAGTSDVTANAYDQLNRLIRVTDPGAGQVNYGYNGRDQLVSVSDPRSLVTSYAYDGLDNLNQLVSPDTGTTTNTYDPAGNVLTATDAKGQVTSYAYDALNRVTSITYHGGVTHTYQYDQGTNGLGRLTRVTEPNSTTQYAYDQKGRLITETRTINALAYTTSYGYDNAGRLTSVIYPSGRQVAYTLDTLGRIQQIATSKNNTPQTIVSAVAYRPFGPVQGFTFGNGQTYSRGYDQDGRMSSYTLATQTIAVGYDPASRISSLSDAANPTDASSYSYDTRDQLTSFTRPGTNQSFSYDAVGNRLSKMVGVASSTYAYPATSNRLSQITGSNPRSYTHDPVGSITADGVNTFAYDTRGRMVQSVGALGATDYKLNSLGQRIRKTNSQADTVYHYDSQGRLIAESSAAGVTQKEYVYLGDIPVAIVVGP